MGYLTNSQVSESGIPGNPLYPALGIDYPGRSKWSRSRLTLVDSKPGNFTIYSPLGEVAQSQRDFR
jgi:hypothetical protein